MVVLATAAGTLSGVLSATSLWRGRARRSQDRPQLPTSSAWLVLPLTAAAAAAAAYFVPAPWTAAAVAYTLGAVPLAWIDLDVHRIPDRVLRWVAAAVAISLLTGALVEHAWSGLTGALLGAAALGVLYLAMALFGSMGLGDVKLAAVTGAVLGPLGWPAVIAGTAAAFALAALAGVVLLLTRRAKRSDHIAFGAAIVAGAIVAVIST